MAMGLPSECVSYIGLRPDAGKNTAKYVKSNNQIK
jgi:hypothetical protein